MWGRNSDDEMCQIDDKDDFMLDEVKIGSSIIHENMKVRKTVCLLFYSFLFIYFSQRLYTTLVRSQSSGS